MKELFIKPHMFRRCVVLLISVFFMGVGVAIFDQLGFGTDPCAMLNLGVSRLIGWSFGNWQVLFNAMILVIILALKEIRRIGLGSLANMILVGYSADFASWVLNQVHPLNNETLLVKSIIFVPTIVMFLIAVAFYMVVDLGVAPYDAMPQIIAGRQKKFSFTVIRIFWDIGVIIAGLLVGGTAGIVTIVLAFLAGPLISAIAKKFQRFF